MESLKGKRMKAEFGKRLRACRIASGYVKGADMARALDIELARYRKYERGQSIPPLDVLQEICRLLDRDANFLLLGIKPPKVG